MNVLIKQDGLYYSINNEYYDDVIKSYIPLESADFTKCFDIVNLFKSITIKLETFKPIDKFDNFQLTTQTKPTSIKLSATKTSSELIVANDDISTLVASNIDSFNLISSQMLGGSIKAIISTDKGLSWLTHNGVNFVSINVNIPLKKYKLMTVLEKENYNLAKEEIILNGIDTNILNTLDFTTLSSQTLRFAYVLSRPTYSSVSENNKLNWQFDSQGCMQKMKRSEFECMLHSGGIGLKYLVASAIIKADIMVSEDVTMK